MSLPPLPPPRPLPLHWAALAYVSLLLLSFLFVGQTCAALLPDHPRLALLGTQVLGVLLPALVMLSVLRAGGFSLSTSRKPPPSPLPMALGLAGMAVGAQLFSAVLAVGWLMTLRSAGWAWVPRLERLVAEAYGKLLETDGTWDLLALLLLVSILPALCEELAFRRGLQGLLAARWPAPVAIGVTALVFSAFHLEPFGFPSRFFLGVSLGIAYHRTGSLLVAGLLHAVNNAVAILVMAASGRGPSVELPTPAELEGVPVLALLVAGGLGLGAWALGALLLLPRPEPSP